jgi:hypothetical protein
MDHSRAAEIRAAERYVLGELPAEEAEEFERHFFECADCAESVEAGSQFLANARAVFGEGVVEPGRKRSAATRRFSLRERLGSWWSMGGLVPAAAALAFGAIAIYQGVVTIPGLRQAFDTPRQLPAFQLAGLSRGAGASISVPAGTASLALAIDIPPDIHFSRYLGVVTAGGRTLFQVEVAPPAEGQPVTILVPAHSLSPGADEFTLYGLAAGGQPRDTVATSSFTFQFK